MKTPKAKLIFGDIILAYFFFTDFSGAKKRPCFVLKQHRDDILVCFISSKVEKKESQDIIVQSDHQNGLATTSVIKILKMNTIHRKLIYKKIGTLKDPQKKDVQSALVKLIDSF